METTNERNDRPINYVRRVVVSILCLSPLLLHVVSGVANNRDPSDPALGGAVRGSGSALAFGFLGLATVIALINFHLTILRPLIYRLRHGSTDGLRFVSVIPLIGPLAVLTSGVVGFGDIYVAILGIAVFLVDTGSTFWIFVYTWRYGIID